MSAAMNFKAADSRSRLSGARGYMVSLLVAPLAIACHQGSTAPVPSELTILSLSPSSGPPGTSVTITGTGFTPTANTVAFGNGVIPNLSSNGTILIFTVPTTLIPACAYTTPPCPFALVITSPGTYGVSVTNASGSSNSVTFVVTSGVNTPVRTAPSHHPSWWH